MPARSRGLLAAAVIGAVAVTGGVVALAAGDDSGATPGWSHLDDIPIERRGSPVVEWTGEALVVLGGARTGEGGGTQWTADGAAFDASSDSWEDIPASPLGALAEPTGAWTGEELLVLGTPCHDDLPVDEGAEGCQPGGVGILALTPDRKRWRTVAVPDELRRAARSGALSVSGSVGEQLLVSRTGGRDRWLWHPESGAVRAIPVPPIDVDGICPGGEDLVALDYQVGGAPGTPGADADQDVAGIQFAPKPVVTATLLDAGATRLAWSSPRGAPVDTRGFEYAWHACAGDGALVVRHGSSGRQALEHFDGERWRSVPPALLPLEIGGFTAWDGERLLAWTGDPERGGKAILAFDPATASWSNAGHTEEAPTEVVPAGDRLVLYTFGAAHMSFDAIKL